MEQSLRDYLRAVDYVIVDAARSSEIAPRCQSLQEDDWQILWELAPDQVELASVAPYLVRWRSGSPFVEWFLQKGWGRQWGVCCALRQPISIDDLRRHFQQQLMVQVEGKLNELFYFRFYDPRVLRIFLDICTLEQARQFFGAVKCFFVESENPNELYRYTLTPAAVKKETLAFQ